MTMEDHCEWMSLAPDPDGARYLRLVRGSDGFRLFVRAHPDRAYRRDDGTPIWQFHLSPDGSHVTLTGAGSNSVKYVDEAGREVWHPTVTDWPLRTESSEG
jgi:hypothetical protein